MRKEARAFTKAIRAVKPGRGWWDVRSEPCYAPGPPGEAAKREVDVEVGGCWRAL